MSLRNKKNLNSWHVFVETHRGQGLSLKELSQMYKQQQVTGYRHTKDDLRRKLALYYKKKAKEAKAIKDDQKNKKMKKMEKKMFRKMFKDMMNDPEQKKVLMKMFEDEKKDDDILDEDDEEEGAGDTSAPCATEEADDILDEEEEGASCPIETGAPSDPSL